MGEIPLTTKEITLEIMLKLIENEKFDVREHFQSEKDKYDILPEKVGEFYNKLYSTIEKRAE